jgi:hypothetical protein
MITVTDLHDSGPADAPRPAARLALVHSAAYPAPGTTEYAQALARFGGMPPAEARRFIAWVCSLSGSPALSRPHLRVVR